MKAEVLQEGEILGGVSTREVEWIELVYYKLDNTRESIRLNQEMCIRDRLIGLQQSVKFLLRS